MLKSEVPATDRERTAVKRGVKVADEALREIQSGAVLA